MRRVRWSWKWRAWVDDATQTVWCFCAVHEDCGRATTWRWVNCSEGTMAYFFGAERSLGGSVGRAPGYLEDLPIG